MGSHVLWLPYIISGGALALCSPLPDVTILPSSFAEMTVHFFCLWEVILTYTVSTEDETEKNRFFSQDRVNHTWCTHRKPYCVCYQCLFYIINKSSFLSWNVQPGLVHNSIKAIKWQSISPSHQITLRLRCVQSFSIRSNQHEISFCFKVVFKSTLTKTGMKHERNHLYCLSLASLPMLVMKDNSCGVLS